MTVREPTLILSHLIKSDILQDNGADEVLTLLEHDAASSIAVTTVSSFSADGSIPKLDSEFKIDWMMQAIAYCFSLSTLYQDAISAALDIFHRWIVSTNFFKDSQTQNKYTQQLFRYLSLVVDFEHDNLYPGPRHKLVVKMQKQLRDCIENTKYFDDTTWDTLIRVLIGCSDFLTTESITQTLPDIIRLELLSKFYELMFLAIQKSNLTTSSIWELIDKYVVKWGCNEQFLNNWSIAIQSEYQTILTNLYDENFELNKNCDRKIINCATFRIVKYTNGVSADLLAKEIPLFTIFSLMFEKIMKISQNFIAKSTNLYVPLFPADFYFSLFGKFIFEPFMKYDHVLLKIHTAILMFICGSWDLSNSKWKPHVLNMVTKSIHDQLKFIIVMNGYQVLSRFMNDQIIDTFNNMLMQPAAQFYTDEAYFYNFTLLMQQIGEVRKIDNSIFRGILDESQETRTISILFNVIIKQDPTFYVQQVSSFLQKYSSSQFAENVIANLNILTASNLPFINVPLAEYLSTVFPVVSERSQYNSSLLMSFLVLITQMSAIGDDALKSGFLENFVTFAQSSQDFNFSRFVNYAVMMLAGQPLDTSLLDGYTCKRIEKPEIDERLKLQPIFSVFLNDDRIVSLVGDRTRKSSFVIHIREPRGLFAFELEDCPAKNELSELQRPTELSQPPSHTLTPIECGPCTVEGAEDRMKEAQTFDDSYSQPSTTTYPHVKVIEEQLKDSNGGEVLLRHKFIDFLVQTGLHNSVSKIDEPEKVIKDYDSIDSFPVINVELLHLSNKPVNNDSQSFVQFCQTLGSHYEFSSKTSMAMDMGVCLVRFDEDAKDSDIAVIYSESSMAINTASPDFPKRKLVIIVEPHTTTLYRIAVLSSAKSFALREPEFRCIRVDNVGREIASLVFDYKLNVSPDIIFGTIEKRMEFLSGVKRTLMHPIELASCLHTEEFKPLNV